MLHVVFATVGMGVDIPDIRQVIHVEVNMDDNLKLSAHARELKKAYAKCAALKKNGRTRNND